MLTQLSTVKSRLALVVTDYDDLLTNAIRAVSDRFDKETNRILCRTTTATHEFDATDSEILPPYYPIESVTKFELKSNETDGWSEQTGVEYLLRRNCVLSLRLPLGASRQLGRITYTGGYVLPGTSPSAGSSSARPRSCWASTRCPGPSRSRAARRRSTPICPGRARSC